MLGLTKQTLEIEKVISDDEYRPTLNCLHVTKDMIEASNGQCLIQCKHKENKEFKEILIPKDIIKDMKRDAKRLGITLFSNGKQYYKTSEGKEVNFQCDEQTYPDTGAVFPKGEKQEYFFNIHLLANVFTTLSKMEGSKNTKVCKLTFFNEYHGNPAKIEFDNITALVMPCKPL